MGFEPMTSAIPVQVEHCIGIHSRGHGFESRSGLNFFQALILCITGMINHVFTG